MMRIRMQQVVHADQRGVALILVLWVVALMTILLGSFALIARTENLQARHLLDATTARYAAQAGLDRAVFELRNPDPLMRWVADGRGYDFEFEGAQIHVELTDETGKIDLNTVDAPMIKSLFLSAGIDEGHADALADAILDWRDADDLVRPNGAESAEYKQAGLAYGPRNAPFASVSEVQQVLGMDYNLYTKIEPAITIYSGTSMPNPAFAPLQALMALPGMTPEFAQQLIAARQQLQPGQDPGAGPTLTLPDGTPVVANGGGLTYSIKSRATLGNGASTTLDASIRLGGVSSAGRPYIVLRWRDGEAS